MNTCRTLGTRAGVYVVAAAVGVFTSCASGTSPATPTLDTSASTTVAGSWAFHASPIATDAISWITPLGNLNPPAHALPTDHIYFYFANPDAGETPAARRTSFFAPGDGTVFDVLGGNGSDSKVFVRVSPTLYYYIDHLILDLPVSRGTKLMAGQRLGTTGSAYGVDLGVVNETRALGFLNPSRYGFDTLHADAPLKYYDEPMRSLFYGKVQRLGPDLDGRIDYDVAGRLAGDWFGDNLTPLAFVYDTYDPAKVLISISDVAAPGVYAIAAGDPAPIEVSVASGKVLYTLTRSITGPRSNVGGAAARMLVQMIDDTHIRAEMFAPQGPQPDFTANARSYSR